MTLELTPEQAAALDAIKDFLRDDSLDAFVLRGSGSRPGANVRYLTGDRDITAEMRSAAGWRVPLSPKGPHDLTVRITPRQSAKVSSVQTATVSATWRGDGSRVDVVKARVRVVR